MRRPRSKANASTSANANQDTTLVLPSVESVIKSAVIADPGSEPDSEPAAEPVAEPVVEPAAEPVVEPAAEPVAEPAAEPVAEAELPPAQIIYIDPVDSESTLPFDKFVETYPPSEFNPRVPIAEKLFSVQMPNVFGKALNYFQSTSCFSAAEDVPRSVEFSTKLIALAQVGDFSGITNWLLELLTSEDVTPSLDTGLLAFYSDRTSNPDLAEFVKGILVLKSIHPVNLSETKKALISVASEVSDDVSRIEHTSQVLRVLCTQPTYLTYQASVNLSADSKIQKPLVVAPKSDDAPAEILDGNTRTEILLRVLELIQNSNPYKLSIVPIIEVQPVVYRIADNSLTRLQRFSAMTLENGSTPMSRLSQIQLLASFAPDRDDPKAVKGFVKQVADEVLICGRRFTPSDRSILKRWVMLPPEIHEAVKSGRLYTSDVNVPLNFYAGVTKGLQEACNGIDSESIKAELGIDFDEFCANWLQHSKLSLAEIFEALKDALPSNQTGGITTHITPVLVKGTVSLILAELIDRAPQSFASLNFNSEPTQPAPVFDSESKTETQDTSSYPNEWRFDNEVSDPSEASRLRKRLPVDAKIIFSDINAGTVPAKTCKAKVESIVDRIDVLSKLQESIYGLGITNTNASILAPAIAKLINAISTIEAQLAPLEGYVQQALAEEAGSSSGIINRKEDSTPE